MLLAVLTPLLVAPLIHQANAFNIRPATITQGNPVEISITATSTLAGISKLSIGGVALPVFMHDGVPVGLYGVDLKARTGTTTLTLDLADGKRYVENIFIEPRIKVTAPLGIPEKLGGNTP